MLARVNKFTDFYYELYFMPTHIFHTHVAKLSHKNIEQKYTSYIHNSRNTPFEFYVNHMLKPDQIELYHIITRTSWCAVHYSLRGVGMFFYEMQNSFFKKEFSIPKTLHRKLPKVLVHIINEYVPKHFIDLYKACDACQKQNLIKWYKCKFFTAFKMDK